MKYQEDFGRFLALALAIHRRDEVATAQFIKAIANEVTINFEESELTELRSTASKERYEERLIKHMADYMKELEGLIDADGRKWLQAQIRD